MRHRVLRHRVGASRQFHRNIGRARAHDQRRLRRPTVRPNTRRIVAYTGRRATRTATVRRIGVWPALEPDAEGQYRTSDDAGRHPAQNNFGNPLTISAYDARRRSRPPEGDLGRQPQLAVTRAMLREVDTTTTVQRYQYTIPFPGVSNTRAVLLTASTHHPTSRTLYALATFASDARARESACSSCPRPARLSLRGASRDSMRRAACRCSSAARPPQREAAVALCTVRMMPAHVIDDDRSTANDLTFAFEARRGRRQRHERGPARLPSTKTVRRQVPCRAWQWSSDFPSPRS